MIGNVTVCRQRETCWIISIHFFFTPSDQDVRVPLVCRASMYVRLAALLLLLLVQLFYLFNYHLLEFAAKVLFECDVCMHPPHATLGLKVRATCSRDYGCTARYYRLYVD